MAQNPSIYNRSVTIYKNTEKTMQWSNFQIITDEATVEEVVSHSYLEESTLREWLTDNFLPPSKVPSWFWGAQKNAQLSC